MSKNDDEHTLNQGSTENELIRTLMITTKLQACVRRFLICCRPKREAVQRTVQERQAIRKLACRNTAFTPGQEVHLDLVRDLPTMTAESAHIAMNNLSSLKKGALNSNLVRSIQWLALTIQNLATLADQNTMASLHTELQVPAYDPCPSPGLRSLAP